MDILKQFLNQECTWIRSSDQTDEWGQPIPAEEKKIVCRVTVMSGLVPGKMGENVKGTTNVIAFDPVSVGDSIVYDGVFFDVVGIAEPRWINGAYIGRFLTVEERGKR